MNDGAFWDGIAEKYARRPVGDEAAYEDWLAIARRHLTVEMEALEIGCGTGTTALKLAPSVGRIVATDVAPKMVEIAEGKRAAAGIGNVEFLAAGAGEATLPAGPFDAVLAFNLLHLLRDVPAALADIGRRVKPGGLFLSKTGLLGEAPFYLGAMIAVMRAIGKAPFVNRFEQATLERWIAEAGFEIVEAKTYPGMAPTRFVVARKT